jgi:hypothetical protein
MACCKRCFTHSWPLSAGRYTSAPAAAVRRLLLLLLYGILVALLHSLLTILCRQVHLCACCFEDLTHLSHACLHGRVNVNTTALQQQQQQQQQGWLAAA